MHTTNWSGMVADIDLRMNSQQHSPGSRRIWFQQTLAHIQSPVWPLVHHILPVLCVANVPT